MCQLSQLLYKVTLYLRMQVVTGVLNIPKLKIRIGNYFFLQPKRGEKVETIHSLKVKKLLVEVKTLLGEWEIVLALTGFKSSHFFLLFLEFFKLFFQKNLFLVTTEVIRGLSLFMSVIFLNCLVRYGNKWEVQTLFVRFQLK